MKPWPTRPLGELCDVRIGRTPRRDQPRFWGGSAVWVTVGELNGGQITSSKENVSDAAVRECMPEPVAAGTLLFSFKLSIGKMAVAGCSLYTNEAIAALPIHEPKELSRDFLRYSLAAHSHEGLANTAVLGKVLNKEKVQQLSIPVPPLAEQERIVKLLDEANELRKLRAQADRRTAALVPALFHEMFGDPEHTAFPVKQLAELVLPERPITYGILKPGPDVLDGVPYVRVLDIKQNRLHVHQLLRTTNQIATQYRRSLLLPGDILVTIRGTVGRTCIVPEELKGANITQDTARLAVISTIEPSHLVEFLNTSWAQKWMSHRMLGQAVKGLNLGDLRKLPVPVPPLPLQKEFASHVTEIRGLETAQAASRVRLEALFQSMLFRAFQGEL
jgi:type I restriction enzyme S subunit